MGRDAAAVAHDGGRVLLLPAVMAAVSVPVTVVGGDLDAVVVLTSTAVVTATVGGGLARRYRHARAQHRWPAIEVVALAWATCALLGAAVLWGLGQLADPGTADATFRAPVDALFEATSGITSTGLTVVDDAESELSPIVQWWRSLLQWVGGVGVVLFVVGFGHTASRTSLLYEAEGRSDEIGGDVRRTVRAIAAIYGGLTVAACVAFLLTEQPPWVAVNHAMTGIATGGFTVTDDSFAGFGRGTQAVAAAVMAVGAVSFAAHHLLFVERDLRRWWRFTPLRAQVAWLTGGILVVPLVAVRFAPDVEAFDAAFQWVSAAATAGFASHEDLAAWGGVLLPALTVAMLIGAPSGSTGGGVKLDRVVWAAKDAVSRRPGSGGHPAPITWDREPVGGDERRRTVRHAWEMLGLWLVTLAVAAGLLSLLTDAPAAVVAFDTASALSNVGLDTGLAGGQLPWSGKVLLTLVMYLGRLELLAALVLASQREHITARRGG